MNTVDLINKVAISNNLTASRTEMIFGIVVEKISDGLKKHGEVSIDNFGTFRVSPKKLSSALYSEERSEVKNYVFFSPDKAFLEFLNT